MKIADTITYCLNYHKINSRPNTLANYQFLLRKFGRRYQNRDLVDITTEEIRLIRLMRTFRCWSAP